MSNLSEPVARPKFQVLAYVLQPLPHPARGLCKAAIDNAPDGVMVRISEVAKTRLQEEKYHAMIGDIARQFTFCNRLWDAEDMKRLLIDQFKRDTIKDPDYADLWAAMGNVDIAPSLDGSGVVALGTQSRKFPKKLAIGFIEWLHAFGAENEIAWGDPVESFA